MQTTYADIIALLERAHRGFLEVVKLELDNLRVPDINNMQAMILFNIGDFEMTVGELTTRGCYLGANVSYNVKKLLENGYIVGLGLLIRGIVHSQIRKRDLLLHR